MDDYKRSTWQVCIVKPKKKSDLHFHSINEQSPELNKYLLKKPSVPFLAIFILILSISASIGVFVFHECSKPEQHNVDSTPTHYMDINDTFADRVETINKNALGWIDTLNVDPVWLRDEMGIKGKKKLVELLDIYYCLYMTTESLEMKRYYRERVENSTQVIHTPDYHDMDIIEYKQFKEDSTSYLRACWIMEKMELDTTYYLKNIEKVLPRFNRHLPIRGTNQKMAFVFYYNQFGFDINYTMGELFQDSVIKSRKSMETLSHLEIYFITHEVFFLHDHEAMSLMDKNDTEYLKWLLPELTERYMEENDVDLLAELFIALTDLRLDHLEIYDTVLDFLLDSQNENGSFGDYEYERDYCKKEGLNIDVDYLLYLHTTEVSLIAINEALR